MEKYFVTYTGCDEASTLQKFPDLNSALRDIKEDKDGIMKELRQQGYTPILYQEDKDGTEIYVPDTNIYHSWVISKVKFADCEKMYVVTAEWGENDENNISTPLWAVSEEYAAQAICEEFKKEGSSGYKEYAKAALNIPALDKVSLTCTEVPFLGSQKQPAASERIRKAEWVLIDNGIDPVEVTAALQALGYVLLDQELYDETSLDFSAETIPVYPDIRIEKAEQVLTDNGIDPDEASAVLQALGYVLLDEELYPCF